MVKRLLVILLFFYTGGLFAAHLVGGEITYKCLGNDNYEIELTIYRDCFSSGASFDPQAAISIFNASGILVLNVKPFIHSTAALALNAPSNCSQLPNLVCTEMAIYKITVNLPPIAGGYTITHQRCCRNATINNIPNPDTWGATYTTDIPEFDNCNSSPAFNETPPVVLCLNRNFELNMSATDLNGDSLHYELCSVLTGGGQNQGSNNVNSPAPDPAAPPPYSIIPFSVNFSATHPLIANPAITINPATGMMTGRPTQLGQFTFGICVSEFKNGQFINSIRRDFQFNVTDKCNSVISVMEDQIMNPSTLCNGRTISFKNIGVNSKGHFWDFGDPSTDADTSRLAQPTYTYADTGTYLVKLIADPGEPCADTTVTEFRAYYPVEPSFEYAGESCYENNEISFTTKGNFSANAQYKWDFGGATNIGRNSNLANPTVNYTNPGKYYIKLQVTDFKCEGTFTDSVFIYPFPVLQHFCPKIKICAPATVQFHDSSSFMGLGMHWWDFGDGNTSRDASPQHTYESGGIYTITHTVQTFEGCEQILVETFTDYITVYHQPNGNIEINPDSITIYDPIVQIKTKKENHNVTETLLPDGRLIENLDSTYYIFNDTGVFEIIHIEFNEFGCTDTTYKRVFVDAPLNFFIPDAFTPNGDFQNEEFKMSITGINNFWIRIFNRWGEIVFESKSIHNSWNGNIRNGGEQAPPGLYTFQIIVETKENARSIKKEGTVHLIR